MLQAVELTIRLHPDDDVVIARMELATGTLVTRENVRAAVSIPAGHKLAVHDVAQGKPVRRYNQIIGFATRDIRAGEHVHVHSLAMGNLLEHAGKRLSQSGVILHYLSDHFRKFQGEDRLEVLRLL